MREIKFRAWDNDNKVMHFSNENEDDIVWEITPLIKFLEMRTIDSFPGGEYHLQEDAWVAPNQTLMQYTGLLDKNGKEIYEGDIVKYIRNNKVIVASIEWRDGEGCYHLLNNADPFDSDSMISESMFFVGSERCEIIGNIYENKDLLSTQPSQE